MARSNYADEPTDDWSPHEFLIRLGNYNRAYTPSASERDIEGSYSNLAADSFGDHFWRPRFYRRDPGYTFTCEEVDSFNDGWTHYESDERRAELEAQMPTYRPPRHPRACPSCHLTACLGPDYHELADTQDFQQRARAAHRQAGDYNRHTHDYSIP